MTSPVSNPVYVIHCSLSVLVDILFYLWVRPIGMCSVPKHFLPIIANQLGTRCFLGARIVAPNVMQVAHPCCTVRPTHISTFGIHRSQLSREIDTVNL